MSKILIDTNVMIYALDNHSKYFRQANNISEDDNNTNYTTSKNILEFFAVASKLKFDSQTVKTFYSELKQNFIILFPTLESLTLFEHLIDKYKPNGNKVFDIELVSIILINSIKQIATFNQKDFENIDEVSIISSIE